MISSSTKALAAVYGPIRKRVSDRRTARKLKNAPASVSCADLKSILSSLDPAIASRIQGYFESPDFASVAFQLATKQLLSTVGEDLQELETSVKAEMHEGIRLATESAGCDEKLVSAIYEALMENIQVCLRSISHDDQVGASPAARAMIIRSATTMAAASARNDELLRSISSLAEIHRFEKEYRAAIAAAHGTMRLPHAGTSRQVPFEQLFVEPILEISGDERNDPADPFSTGHDSIKLAELVASNPRIVILGDPGGGKSTCTLKLLYDIAAGRVEQVGSTIPFLVILRDYATHYSQGASILEFIELVCKTTYSISPPENSIEYCLLNGRAIVFFDGLDELLDTADRRRIVGAVEGFANRYPTVEIVVTSRKVGYNEAALSNEIFSVARLGSFDEPRRTDYVGKWFTLDDAIEPSRVEGISQAFLNDSRFVNDLTSNPLMLSLMCGIYAFEGYIPRNRPEVYEKCALLLFERWDKQRGIIAPISFDAHVQSAIRSIAYRIYTHSDSKAVIERDRLVSYVKSYLLEKRFDDELQAEQASIEFIDFCKGRAWVLTDLGADVYGFTHRTFLEYFSASHLVRTNTSPKALLSKLWGRIRKAEWDVVCQLSLQILGKSVDDGADNFLAFLIRNRFSTLVDDYEKRNAIVFALRSLSFVVPKPDVLRDVIATAADLYCETDQVSLRPGNHPLSEDLAYTVSPVGLIVAVTEENRALASKYLFDRIRERISTNPDDLKAIALGCHLVDYSINMPSAVDANKYWREKCQEFEHEIKDVLRSHCQSTGWIAKLLVLSGDLSMDRLLERYGMGILFGGEESFPMNAPWAYYMIHSRLASDRYAILATPEVRTSVRNYLVKNQPPWIDVDYAQARYMFGMVGRGSSRSPVTDTSVLLSAICFEADMFLDADRRIGSRRRPDGLGNRSGFISSQFENFSRSVSRECLELVRRWEKSEVNFIKTDDRADFP
ncbi:NACHT domain-containing protein [Nocardia otitidiscaviarum]|uniref:NACHT domain-containing protein n=1 Tax=Nocardia otitidiscaviarum TaxID=1823 RepID=UPI0024550AC3|nr:NACHT domain-containing protein [Nocardia otitidiscaviarum]